MIHVRAAALALMAKSDDHEILRELLLDKLYKAGIVVAALVALGAGMAIIWKRTGNGSKR